MATERMDTTASVDQSSGVLVPGADTVLYGLVAAGGTLAVANGLESYAAYTGGVPDPALHLLGVVVTLGVGFTLLSVALSGAVAVGVEHAD